MQVLTHVMAFTIGGTVGITALALLMAGRDVRNESMNDLQAKSTNTLALCPFCGGEADVIDYDDECWVAHQCANGTSVETNSYETEAEAIAAWNSRAPIEYEGWFYLPKPKKGIVQYGEPYTEKVENGYKIKQPVEVIESAIRSWGDELGEYVMKRICEAWNSRAELGSKPPYDELLRCLENDWNIRASWDGLRKFWSIELTEEGVRMRDAELNSRAERTCEFNIKDNMNETEGMGDVWIECSACNCVFDFYADEWLMKMSYCPNCGARRVGE